MPEAPEKVVIGDGLMTYWLGWNMLRDDRPIGAMGGAGGIYYTAISGYARDHGITGDEFGTFLRLIRAMDDEYLKVLVSKRPAADTPPTTETAPA